VSVPSWLQVPISERTRRDIIQTIRSEGIKWNGNLDDDEFLSRIYDLDKMESTDGRYENARGDIRQHRISNYDWSDDWIFDDRRFSLLDCPDTEFLRFLCEMIHPIVRPNKDEAQKLLEMFNENLADEGYRLVQKVTPFGKVRYEPEGILSGTTEALEEMKDIAQAIDSEYMQREIVRMNNAIEKDPELAIGTAKEFIETVCKTILKERGKSFKDDEDLPKLAYLAFQEVQPMKGVNSKEAEEIVRKTLGSLSTITQSVAELRNLHGTGHGKDADTIPLKSRHAALAVNAATALALFLYQSHQEK
jgi:AbiJ N-terminal domain 3/Abortive infection C-terminus